MRISTMILALSLAGCTPPAYKSEIITGTEDGVSIKAGHYANPGPDASEHCGQYGKQAVLTSRSGDIYQFACQN